MDHGVLWEQLLCFTGLFLDSLLLFLVGGNNCCKVGGAHMGWEDSASAVNKQCMEEKCILLPYIPKNKEG